MSFQNIKIMKIDDKYRILPYEQHLPVEVEQKELDETLKKLKDAAKDFHELLEDMEKQDSLISNMVYDLLDSSSINIKSNNKWKIENLIYNIEELEENLKNSNDDISSYEDSMNIFDLGFKEYWIHSGVYEKTLIDNDKQEVVEEIFSKDDTVFYRKRTIIWEKSPYGKASKDIIYEDLPIDEKLDKIIKNSLNLMHKVR